MYMYIYINGSKLRPCLLLFVQDITCKIPLRYLVLSIPCQMRTDHRYTLRAS